MIYVDKIIMKKDCENSSSPIEIDQLHLTGGLKNPGWYKKSEVYDFIKNQLGIVRVKIFPFPKLIPAISSKGEKYVRSESNSTTNDNLMNLPREDKE